MATNKKSFIFYCDWIDTFQQLPDDKAGELIKFILSYVNDENPKTDDVLINAVFAQFKNTLKRDLQKWEDRAQKNRENGKKGGRPKKNPKKPTGLNENPEKPVSVSDSVNVNVSDSVIQCYEKCLKHFPDTLHPKTEKIKSNWLDTIDKLNRIDKLPFEFIEEITEKARKDSFWRQNFLSMVKLRKKNSEGVPYVVVFFEKFMRNGDKKSNGQGVELDELAGILKNHFDKQANSL